MKKREFEMTILVGTDFGAGSDRALEHAISLAEQRSARLCIVHVCRTTWAADGEMTALLRAGMRLEALRAHVAEQVHADAYLRLGQPAPCLLDAIQELRPDLVILGSHGRGAVRRALLGSVTARLCRKSPVPVLVVP